MYVNHVHMLRERVNKLADNSKEDFEVLLPDYCEAIGDCGWTDQLNAHWFSSAKHTWLFGQVLYNVIKGTMVCTWIIASHACIVLTIVGVIPVRTNP